MSSPEVLNTYDSAVKRWNPSWKTTLLHSCSSSSGPRMAVHTCQAAGRGRLAKQRKMMPALPSRKRWCLQPSGLTDLGRWQQAAGSQRYLQSRSRNPSARHQTAWPASALLMTVTA